MKLIVGLGNPGEKYEKTRHNVGFVVIEKFLNEFSKVNTPWQESKKLKGHVSEIEWQRRRSLQGGESKEKDEIQGVEKVILLKPKTYMNNSGLSVRLTSDFYKVSPENVWILHDDLDLPLGTLKIRFGGASAGHKGIESIISSLGTDKFWRFRMGIGHPHRKNLGKDGPMKMARRAFGNVEDFVLGNFGHGEGGKAKDLIKRSVNAIEMGLESGLGIAMNRFNSK